MSPLIANLTLTNVTVVDNALDIPCGDFPTTLAVGQTVECIVAGVEHCDSVTNTVTASGVGASSGIRVSTNDSAGVVIKPIGITCNVTVNGKPFVEIPCDGQEHLVTNEVEICNTGELPLTNITLFAPDVVARGSCWISRSGRRPSSRATTRWRRERCGWRSSET